MNGTDNSADADVDLDRAVAAYLADVTSRIDAAAGRAGRQSTDVTLVAISKMQPDARIDAALAAGHRVFGENRVQEAQGRWTQRRAGFPELELHLVGPLQTNKVRDAVALFDVIQTLDRQKLADRLAAEFERIGEARRCFIEVNTGEEAQKAGVAPGDTDTFVAYCRGLGLPVEGLMCIPPAGEPAAPHFALLARIAAHNGLDRLSMGMSADYEAAVELGATHVRVGTGVFGARPPRS
jgi:pyridoxal phosphate enzyme (YggS family)